MSEHTVIYESVIKAGYPTCEQLIEELNSETEVVLSKQNVKSGSEEVFHILPEELKDQIYVGSMPVGNMASVGTVRFLRLTSSRARIRITVTTKPDDFFERLAGRHVQWKPNPELVTGTAEIIRKKFNDLGLWSKEIATSKPDRPDAEA